MVNDAIDAAVLNARTLDRELSWFGKVLADRLLSRAEGSIAAATPIDPPDHPAGESPYADFVRHYEITFGERFVLMLALVPHIRPALPDALFLKNEETDRGFSEFGGLGARPMRASCPRGRRRSTCWPATIWRRGSSTRNCSMPPTTSPSTTSSVSGPAMPTSLTCPAS